MAYYEMWKTSQQDAEFEAPEVVTLRQERGVVKRGRKCTRCGRVMPPGTAFEAFAVKVDGEFQSDVSCVRLGDEWECPLKLKEARDV